MLNYQQEMMSYYVSQTEDGDIFGSPGRHLAVYEAELNKVD